MKWFTKLLRRLWFGPKSFRDRNPINPDCHWTIDMNGRGYLHVKDEAAFRKHFARQIEGAKILGELIKKNGSVKIDL